jgi:hypothetical protein
MKRAFAILIGFLISLILLIGVFFNVLNPYSIFLLFLAPLIGGFFAACLGKGGYIKGIVNGIISFFPFLIILTILSVMLLNTAFDEPLFNGSWGHDLLQISPILLIICIFLLLTLFGSMVGVLIRKRSNS